MTNSSGITIAAVVDGSFLLGFGGTFIRTVSGPINAGASVNSDSESRRGSNGGWTRNVVRIAELDTVIADLMERQMYRVKLHNPAKNAIRQWDERLVPEFEAARLKRGLTRESRMRQNDSGPMHLGFL